MSSSILSVLTAEAPNTKRGIERRCAVLACASDLFLQHGYEAVSLDDIVQHAGGSKATIYKYFGNKEGLFSAICDERRERLFNDICRPFYAAHEQLSHYLTQTLQRFYWHIVQPENIAFLRVFSEHAQRNPTLGQSLYDKCSVGLQQDIATALRICRDRGEINCPNPDYSAMLFFGLLGDVQWKILMGLSMPTEHNAQLAYFDYCIELFLRAHQKT